MIDDSFVLSIERLRDDLKELKADLRRTYKSTTSQVRAERLRREAARIAETWLVTASPRTDVALLVDSGYLADLTVHFQRLLTVSERASQRSVYDKEIAPILKDFGTRFIIPLKQNRGVELVNPGVGSPPADAPSELTAFLGHSFALADENVVRCVADCLKAMGVVVVTGERPKADRISDKVKRRIEEQSVFVGLFTRRDKLVGKNEYSTSAWTIDEKAYAYSKGKKLILLKEKAVGSIGGIQGDYQFIDFSRDALQDLLINLILLFNAKAGGLDADTFGRSQDAATLTEFGG